MSGPVTKLLALDNKGHAVRSLQDAFTEFGFQTFGASDSKSALDIIKKSRPDILIFDPPSLADKLPTFVKAAKALDTSHHSMRLFALGHLPYDPATLAAADDPQIKVITAMMAMAEVVRTVNLHLTAVPSQIKYENGLFQVVHEATREMFGNYLKENLTIDSGQFKQGDRIDGDLMATVTVAGKTVFGTLLIGFDTAFIVELGKAMLGAQGSTIDFSSAEKLELASEVANQLAGLLQNKLFALQLHVNIGLPRSVAGDSLRFIHPGRNRVGSIALRLEGQKKSEGLLNKIFARPGAPTAIEFCFDERSS